MWPVSGFAGSVSAKYLVTGSTFFCFSVLCNGICTNSSAVPRTFGRVLSSLSSVLVKKFPFYGTER